MSLVDAWCPNCKCVMACVYHEISNPKNDNPKNMAPIWICRVCEAWIWILLDGSKTFHIIKGTLKPDLKLLKQKKED